MPEIIDRVKMRDVYPFGIILERCFTESSLTLRHFAFDQGRPITLHIGRGLDLAYDYWDRIAKEDKFPLAVRSYSGEFYERKWIPLETEQKHHK